MPTSWLPVIETDGDRLRVGAGIGGVDVLGYHSYSASATWRVDAPPFTGGDAPPLDWALNYAYDRWVPTVFASASWETLFAGVATTEAAAPAVIPVRSREIEAGLLVPFRRVRISHQALASLIRTDDRFELIGGPVSLNRTAARVGWTTSSAKVFGFSISPERGITAGVTGEAVLDALGSTASASTMTGDVRAYLPGAGLNHVVALRAAAARPAVIAPRGRLFLLGGAAPANGVLDFDADAISLLRGFESNAFAGSRVALVNAEYRWPFARPERGYRHLAGVSAHRSRRGVRRCRPRVVGRVPRRRHQDVARRRAVRRHRARLHAAADGDGRRRVGTRRTARRRQRDRLRPRRPGVLSAVRGLCSNCRA